MLAFTSIQRIRIFDLSHGKTRRMGYWENLSIYKFSGQVGLHKFTQCSHTIYCLNTSLLAYLFQNCFVNIDVANILFRKFS